MLEDKAEVKQQVELKKQEKAKQQSITKQSRRNNENTKSIPNLEKFLSVKRNLIDEAEEKKTDEKASNKTECIICGETFEEDWVQCSRRDGWAHEFTTWNHQEVEVCVKTYAEWVKNFITIDGYFIFYYAFRLIFVHMLPCIALVTLNLLLFRALKQAQKRRDILLSSKKNQKNECRKLRDSNCTTLMLIVVVSVFLLVEIPLAVVTMLHIISSSIIEFLDYSVANTLIIFTNFFIILSYPINFAIYCGMSRQFRETFKELFISGAGNARNGSSKYSVVNGPRTCTNETVL
ncbi:sex peptide receptor-like [Sitophilus oryzae]|uniref:Sex peptide receptor-like n=1 Tax=Sitophilus oryzae TaxID=7048 RepID=A0A6J2X222_SITOR|nr:sex peptide receptor-like [Sitophilus oryzae]